MISYESSDQLSPNVPTIIDGDPMNSRRILQLKAPKHASKYLFTDPSEVEITEREVRSSECSIDGYQDVEYSDNYRNTESCGAISNKDTRINEIKSMKVHTYNDQIKVVFEKPIEILRKETCSDVSSPRYDTSPKCSPQKSDRKSPSPVKIYKPLKRTPPRNLRQLTPDNHMQVIGNPNSDNKQFLMLTKDENLLHFKNKINLITPGKVEKLNTKEDEIQDKEINNITDYLGVFIYREWAAKKENLAQNMAENYRSVSRDHKKRPLYPPNDSNFDCTDQHLIKINTEKAAINIQNMRANQESKTPTRAKYLNQMKLMKNCSTANYASNPNCNNSFNNSFDKVNKNCYQPLKPYYSNMVMLGGGQENNCNNLSTMNVLEDNLHGYYNQLADASKTIFKQDETIQSLRTEIRRLKDIIVQKDGIINMRNLEGVKYKETIEMLQFDLDRLRTEHQNSGYDTPRVQSENKVIRDQIRHLLEEAKEKSREVLKLKKAINMQELYQEELEHKITIMKNKEIKLEEENEQVIEKLKCEEAKCRQLKMEYDELKFQFNRFKILSTDNPKQFNSKYSIYDNDGKFRMTNDYSNQKLNRYSNDSFDENQSPIARSAIPTPQLASQNKRKEWRARDKINNAVIQIDEYSDYNEIISDKLYQKNMKSTIGELLRWDSTKDRNMIRQANRRNNSVNQQRTSNNQPRYGRQD